MIAQKGSCCISVGLEMTMQGPQVRFNVSMGPHHVSGPFFNTGTIMVAVREIPRQVDPIHYRDFLLTMHELWPVTDSEQMRKFKQQLADLEEKGKPSDNRVNGPDLVESSKAFLPARRILAGRPN